ncbi:MAG TPA: hypothetical protein VGC35_08060 [Allosphingosinicella sp.]|jgi:hypothetical protein
MDDLSRIEEFVRISAGIGLFVIVLTIGLMEVVKPYFRSAIQAQCLRGLVSKDDARSLLAHVSADDFLHSVGGRYPTLIRRLRMFEHSERRFGEMLSHAVWGRPGGGASVVKSAVVVGLGNAMVMKVVQNSARAVVEHPLLDFAAYAACTGRADILDRGAGLLLELHPEITAGARYASAKGEDASERQWHEAEASVEATDVRANLAAAVEVRLDEVQASLTARWCVFGRLLAVGVGIIISLSVGLATGTLSGSGIILGGLILLITLAFGGVVSSKVFSNDWLGHEWIGPFHRLLRRLSPLAPLLGLLYGIAAIQILAGEQAMTLLVLGSVSGLIASTVYDACKALGRRR